MKPPVAQETLEGFLPKFIVAQSTLTIVREANDRKGQFSW